MMPTTAEQLLADRLTAKYRDHGWTAIPPQRMYGSWSAEWASADGNTTRSLIARTFELLDGMLAAVTSGDG